MDQQELLNMLTAPLLAWYDQNKRELPWRATRDPYRIWLSEIMLQQTRVQAVLPYYERFLKECPTVFALADMEEEHLFKLWEGLGYYSRARNLKRTAQIVAKEYAGKFPETVEALKKLPGIGEYTAAAVASIAFGKPEPAVDGNLLRVSARVTGIADDIMDSKVRKNFRSMLTRAIDRTRPGEYNQAMMDLGATVCLPNGAPLCAQCPARNICEACRNGLTQVLPVRAAKSARRVEERTVFLLLRGGQLALHKRTGKGLLAGLWEFPNVLGSLDEAGVNIALAQWGLRAERIVPSVAAKHIFTHIEWDMHGYYCEVDGRNEQFVWVDTQGLAEHAIPSAFSSYCIEAQTLLLRRGSAERTGSDFDDL